MESDTEHTKKPASEQQSPLISNLNSLLQHRSREFRNDYESFRDHRGKYFQGSQGSQGTQGSHHHRHHYHHRRLNHFNRRKKTFCCVNCGKEGHVYKQCHEPITSFGIIAFKRAHPDHNRGPLDHVRKYTCMKHNETSKSSEMTNDGPSSSSEMTLTPTLCEFEQPIGEKLLYLMVQRKDTIGFIDFMRGKYPDKSPERERTLKIYLEEMTCEERLKLSQENFENLWDMLWINKLSLLYTNEYMDAKRKFAKLDVHELLRETQCQWTEQEYGFPKGRKNMYESNMECAIREFREETGYTSEQIRIISDKPWEEIFTGTNGIQYRHVYYIAEVLPGVDAPRIPLEDVKLAGEISNLGWFTYDECVNIIRPYDTAKKDLITRIHQRFKRN